MIILGLNVFHADTAACIVKDGVVACAAEEERFIRVKHYSGFPFNSIRFCLSESNLKIQDVDFITVNFDTAYNFKKKLFYSLKNFHQQNIFKKILFSYKRNKISDLFYNHFGIDIKAKILNIPHHLSHIASSFYNSKFQEAIGYSFDGSGDFSSAESYILKDNKFNLVDKTIYPHSLGIFYQAVTQYLGFKDYGDEYKVMGLASYGEPIYKNKFREIINIKNDGEFELVSKYFSHFNNQINYQFETGSPYFDNLYSLNFINLFGKERKQRNEIKKIHLDVAASAQSIFEDIVIEKLKYLYDKYKIDNLCLSGGCAFNSVLNGKIIDQLDYKKIHTGPNVGDAGGAIGSSIYVYLINNKSNISNINLNDKYLGTKYNNEYIEKYLVRKISKEDNIEAKFIENFDEINKIVVDKITNSEVVIWFQDEMEWGPRALGNRSFLADPRNIDIKEIINLKIKKREKFRPFAPSILKEHSSRYFNKEIDSPYMNQVFKCNDVAKKEIKGVVHIDNTCRVHTVESSSNLKFYNLIHKFYEETGVPSLLNTSLNVDEPICESPEDAMEIFKNTLVEIMIVQNWVFAKNKKK